jgi:tRNA(fMet)-specific endonuclease VapC
MTSTYLLDTNTFSYIAKGSSPAARAELQRLANDSGAVLCISAITEAEVRYGMAKHSLSPSRRSAIEGLFSNLRILPWGSEEAAAYARAKAKLETQGITVAVMDMLIAAQAIAAGAVLVSRDNIFARMDDLDAVVNWVTDL